MIKLLNPEGGMPDSGLEVVNGGLRPMEMEISMFPFSIKPMSAAIGKAAA